MFLKIWITIQRCFVDDSLPLPNFKEYGYNLKGQGIGNQPNHVSNFRGSFAYPPQIKSNDHVSFYIGENKFHQTGLFFKHLHLRQHVASRASPVWFYFERLVSIFDTDVWHSPSALQYGQRDQFCSWTWRRMYGILKQQQTISARNKMTNPLFLKMHSPAWNLLYLCQLPLIKIHRSN